MPLVREAGQEARSPGNIRLVRGPRRQLPSGIQAGQEFVETNGENQIMYEYFAQTISVIDGDS